MPYAPVLGPFPSERRSLAYARESAAAPGTGVMPTNTVPVEASFVPEDKVMPLWDESLRSSMAGTYGYIPGPYVADVTIPASPVYGDTIPAFLYNCLGDYTSTGTTTGTSTTINHTGGYPAGTTGAIVVTSGTAFSAGAPGFVQLDTGVNAEIVGYSAAGSTSITLSGTTRFAHATTVAVTQVTAPYTHVFSLLNGTGNAQPPTMTLTDMNYINADLSRWYPFGCMSEIVLTGNAEQLFKWAGKAMAFANSHPASIPTVAVSAVPAQPSWNSKVGLGGTVAGSPVYSVAEWEITLTRDVAAYFTANGQQNPFTIGRGKFVSTGKLNFSPTVDETPLLDLLNNVQPQLQIIQTNGLAGASLVSVQIDIQTAAFETSVIEPGKSLLGYNVAFQAIGNTTNTGNSAGYSPLMITVVNAVPSY